MHYSDKVFIYLKNEIKAGESITIDSLTNDTAKFISTVKELIDDGYVTDIEFSNDYKYIRRMWDFKPAVAVKRKQLINNE